MIRPIRVARLLGVDINLDASVVLALVFAWFYWGYRGSVGAFLLGSVLIILAFLSVLAHELGHAMMARDRGVQVFDVTLSPLAGVARIEQATATPRDEFAIALAGPAVNFAIFMTLLPWVLIIAIVGGLDSLFSAGARFQNLTLASLISAIAVMNISLMVFNLIPAFPLDGGRLLRAFLAMRVGRERATVIATRVGIGIAVLLILLGLVFRDFLMPILGLFIFWAAHHESRIVGVETQMQYLQVGAFSLWDGGGIRPDTPLSESVLGGAHDRVVTTPRGRVLGMLWEADIFPNLDGAVKGRFVRDIMKQPAYIADSAESLWDVQQRMNEHRVRAIPVVDKGAYKGIFSSERFLNLYKQIAPELQDREWELNEEWREAVLTTFRKWFGR